jgi:hypothetical protein
VIFKGELQEASRWLSFPLVGNPSFYLSGKDSGQAGMTTS